MTWEGSNVGAGSTVREVSAFSLDLLDSRETGPFPKEREGDEEEVGHLTFLKK